MAMNKIRNSGYKSAAHVRFIMTLNYLSLSVGAICHREGLLPVRSATVNLAHWKYRLSVVILRFLFFIFGIGSPVMMIRLALVGWHIGCTIKCMLECIHELHSAQLGPGTNESQWHNRFTPGTDKPHRGFDVSFSCPV